MIIPKLIQGLTHIPVTDWLADLSLFFFFFLLQGLKFLSQEFSHKIESY